MSASGERRSTADQHRAKHPVSAVLAGPYGHPWHPLLVPVPIGAWVASLVFDIGSHLVDDPDFLAQGSVWLIAIGVAGALAAATVGFLDLVTIPAGTRAFRTGLSHMAVNVAVTVAYAGNLLWRIDGGDPTGPVPGGQLGLAAASLAALAVGGFLGGKLAFSYGVRVADDTAQAAAFRDSSSEEN